MNLFVRVNKDFVFHFTIKYNYCPVNIIVTYITLCYLIQSLLNQYSEYILGEVCRVSVRSL